MSKRKKKLLRIMMESKQENKQFINSQIDLLERELKIKNNQNKKNMVIKNLKIFGGLCHKVAPYVLVGFFTAGGIKAFGGGLPFKKDYVSNSKRCSVESKINGYIYAYETFNIKEVKDNWLIIYSPWKLGKDNLYYRNVYECNSIGYVKNSYFYEAILTKDISYILTNASFKEYIEKTDIVPSSFNKDDNTYLIDAYVSFSNNNEKLVYIESDMSNKIITLVNMIVTLFLGSVINYKRQFKLRYYINDLNNKYKMIDVSLLENELHSLKEKVKSLNERSK